MALTVQETLQKLGYTSLNPMQAQAISEGLLEAPRALVAAPTASGKTLLALLRMAGNFERTGKKAVYLVPLKALAQEKHHEFTQAFASFGMKVAASTGDFDSSSEELAAADIIIATVEKFDSLLRHNSPWLKLVNLAVVDEVHLLHDSGRGATLEIVFVKLMDLGAQLLALSATVGNAKQLADWLHAQLFSSDYRPTKLVYGVAAGSKLIVMREGGPVPEKLGSGGVLEALVKRCLSAGGQALVFVSTRRSAEAAARDLAPVVADFLKPEEAAAMSLASERALKSLPHPTSQCRALADALSKGSAFHHAGITPRQRSVIEEGFKRTRALKVIVATTTLAMGIDFPASYVVVRDLKRFTGSFAEFLPRFEVAQMAGRSGRPRYDKEGFAVLVCQPEEVDKVLDQYVGGVLEDIESKLSSAAVLRMHCLGLVASGYCSSFKDLFAFFQKSLFAFQYGSTEELLQMVEDEVLELKEMEFLAERKTGTLIPTPLGKRVCELYVDPLSANAYVDFLRSPGDKTELDFLLALLCATEMHPLPSVKRTEEQALFDEANATRFSEFNERRFDDYRFLAQYKSAKILRAWISEQTEEEILEQYDVPPGVMAARLRNAVWLCYAMQELAFLLNATSSHAYAKRLRRRLKHGIKEELLPVCSVKGIGRVRGRKLFNAGYKDAESVRALTKEQLRQVYRS